MSACTATFTWQNRDSRALLYVHVTCEVCDGRYVGSASISTTTTRSPSTFVGFLSQSSHMSGGEEDCTETRLIVEFLEHMLPTEDLRHSAFLISRHYATVVWWALTSYLRIAPGQRDQRDQSRLTDGDYADAWVCGLAEFQAACTETGG